MQQLRVHQGARYLITGALLLVLSSIALVGFTSHPQKAQAAAPVIKIMPLGDSITGSPGCWRALLWNNLQNAGYTNINFVGTLNNSSSCGVPFDGDNEGHGGYLATNIANQNLLPGWLAATNPDIVMMHLGTNDVWNNIAPATILAAFSTLVNQMRANNPHMKILVAQITPMNPSGCSACAQRVIAFNAAIPAWASSLSTAQSPIVVVDQWTGYNDSTDTIDGVHPNASGNAKIAARWYAPLVAQIQSIDASAGGSTPTPRPTTPGTTPTPRPTTTATPNPTATATPRPTTTPTPNPTATATATPVSGGGSCRVSYTTNQWPGGFTGGLAITNTGTTAISGWTLVFTFPGSQQVMQGWNGIYSQSGSRVTVTNASYNGSIAAGSSVNPGFNGSWSGSNPAPTSFTLNGATCSVA